MADSQFYFSANFSFAAKCGRVYLGPLLIRILLFVLLGFPGYIFAQSAGLDPLPPGSLKKLSVEELMDIEVTSISMRPEKLTVVASAVQVLTESDIRRSGVTRLPEALRLVSNLQVSQANSHDWAITARGFNGLPSAGGILANKLLVTIDGRSVYNPLFGGVYWDVQNILLEDLDRIEVVSGPGGTLWGANAVNGVINIVTKSAKDTQGLYAAGGGGSFLKHFEQLRYGFKLNPNLFLRVYGQHFDQKNTVLDEGASAKDAWKMTQGGFRMDYYPSTSATFTVQGDVYGGTENDSVAHTVLDGQNLLGRYTKHFSDESTLMVQAYYLRTWRTTPNSVNRFFYQLNTYDLDIQHRFSAGKKNSLLWGLGYRHQKDQTARTFVPLSRDMPLYSAFVQDELTLVPDRVKLTIGSKFLHNVFSGFEVQPSTRLAWTPDSKHTLWAAVSRAVRLPTRFDSDITVTPQKFDSEKVLAYEAGVRLAPTEKLALSFATFFNHYNHLRSLDSASGPPIILANSQRAESWGFEFSGTLQATDWWRLRGGYTYFDKHIWPVSPKVLPVSVAFEGVDPQNQFRLQSMMDLFNGIQFDLTGRYTDALPSVLTAKKVHSYFTFDARLAWQYKYFEFSVVGQNLLGDHTESGLSKIPRTIYGKVACRL
jgi:iron complex outermembrane recepter protein